MAATLKSHEREDKARRAWRLRTMQGWTETRIAAHMEVNKSTVSRWLTKINAEERALFDKDLADHKAEQVAQLKQLFYELYEAWLRTCEPAESEKSRTKEAGIGSAEGEGDDDTVTEEEDGTPVPVELIDPVLRIQAEEAGIKLRIVERVTTKETKWQAGDPAIAAQMRGCLADIRAIMGLDAPKAEATVAPVIVKVYRDIDMEGV